MRAGNRDAAGLSSDSPEATAGPRGFSTITGDRRDVEERIATMFEGDPERLEQINDLLDELDLLRREFGRRVAIRTTSEVQESAEKQANGRYIRQVPYKVVAKAESNLRKAIADVVPKNKPFDEIEEALYQLGMAHGFASARYVMTTLPFQHFRDQVAERILLRAEAHGSPAAQDALRKTAETVVRLMPLPPAPDDDEIL